MTTDFVTVPIGWTVKQAINYFREVESNFRSALYLYVIDESSNLQGSVSARNLLCAQENDLLQDIFKPVPKHSLLEIDQDLNDIISVMTKYNLYNAAVIDENGKMIGVVAIDDALRLLKPNV